MSAVSTLVAESRARWGLEERGITGRLRCVLITPRYAASRHVLVVVCAGDKPVVFLKIARRGSSAHSLRHEAAVLAAVHRTWPPGRTRVPEVLALDVLGGNVVLVQTAVRGRPQNARLVHADLSGVVGEVEPWLLAAPCTGTADREWAQRQLEEPLERLAAASPGLRGDVESTRAATQSLVAAELPLVLEHGDLREGNLLRSRTGLAVVDWELGRQDGLVLADLVIFSTYVLGCALRTHAPDRLARELVASVDDRWSPLRALLVAHLRAREVGIEWLRPLILASWARYVARLPDRLGEGGAGVLLEVPEVTLWRHLARWAVRQSIRWRS